MTLILVRYGEMGLKSTRVRKRFERIFMENIKEFFARDGLECLISSDWGRIYVRTSKPTEALAVLRRIFGIVSVSPVTECTSKMEDITDFAVAFSRQHLSENIGFAVRARRVGEHTYTSMQLAEQVGKHILEDSGIKGLRVRLSKPDAEIFIDVRKNHAFIYSEILPCAGGMPLGSQGKVVAIMEGNEDTEHMRSAVAAWLMMKRGCKAHIVCADSCSEWVKVLGRWDVKLPVISSVDKIWDEALSLAGKINADGLVTADKPGTPNHAAVKAAGLPLYFPVVGLDDGHLNRIVSMMRQ